MASVNQLKQDFLSNLMSKQNGNLRSPSNSSLGSASNGVAPHKNHDPNERIRQTILFSKKGYDLRLFLDSLVASKFLCCMYVLKIDFFSYCFLCHFSTMCCLFFVVVLFLCFGSVVKKFAVMLKSYRVQMHIFFANNVLINIFKLRKYHVSHVNVQFVMNHKIVLIQVKKYHFIQVDL